MNKQLLFFSVLLALMMTSCGGETKTKTKTKKEAKDKAAVFITLNNKLEIAAHLTHGTTQGMMDQFDGQLATLTSTGAPQKVKDELIAIQKQAKGNTRVGKKYGKLFCLGSI